MPGDDIALGVPQVERQEVQRFGAHRPRYSDAIVEHVFLSVVVEHRRIRWPCWQQLAVIYVKIVWCEAASVIDSADDLFTMFGKCVHLSRILVRSNSRLTHIAAAARLIVFTNRDDPKVGGNRTRAGC